MSETYDEQSAYGERARDGSKHWPHVNLEDRHERREKHRGVQQYEAPETGLTAEGREEVLLKTAPDTGQRTVHPHADYAAPVEAQPASALLAPQTGQALIFKDFIGRRRVPAHGLVSGALDEDARAMSQAQRGVVAHERERGGEERENDEIEHRHEDSFPETRHSKRRPGGEQRHFAFARFFNHPGDGAVGQPRVGV